MIVSSKNKLWMGRHPQGADPKVLPVHQHPNLPVGQQDRDCGRIHLGHGCGGRQRGRESYQEGCEDREVQLRFIMDSQAEIDHNGQKIIVTATLAQDEKGENFYKWTGIAEASTF